MLGYPWYFQQFWLNIFSHDLSKVVVAGAICPLMLSGGELLDGSGCCKLASRWITLQFRAFITVALKPLQHGYFFTCLFAWLKEGMFSIANFSSGCCDIVEVSFSKHQCINKIHCSPKAASTLCFFCPMLSIIVGMVLVLLLIVREGSLSDCYFKY